MILSLFWGIRWPITQNPWRSWHSSATSRTDSTAPACCIDQRTTSHPTLVSLLLKELLDATCPNKNGISRLSRTNAMCLSLSLSRLAEYTDPSLLKFLHHAWKICETRHQSSIMTTTAACPQWLKWTAHTSFFCLTAPTLQNFYIQSLLLKRAQVSL